MKTFKVLSVLILGNLNIANLVAMEKAEVRTTTGFGRAIGDFGNVIMKGVGAGIMLAGSGVVIAGSGVVAIGAGAMVAGEYVKDRPVLAAEVTLCAALVVQSH